MAIGTIVNLTGSPEDGATITSAPLFTGEVAFDDWNLAYWSAVKIYFDTTIEVGADGKFSADYPHFAVQCPTEVFNALSSGSHTWHAVLYHAVWGDIYDTSAPRSFTKPGGLAKPTTPSPANGAGPGINFTNRTVSWVNGGGAETYTVRMDPGDTPYNVVSLSQTGTSYTIPEADISRYQDNIISWRVDAEAGGETVTGDVWTFDPRPAKATTPSPTNGASNTALNLTTLSWVKDAYTDKSEVNCDWSGSVSPFSTSSNSIALANYTPLYMDRLGYSNTYTWSVDTTNEWGTTDGDDWTFDTISYSGASCSWTNYDGKTLGPFDGGVESVDYYWTGTNCVSTIKRVVAFAADRVWITEV